MYESQPIQTDVEVKTNWATARLQQSVIVKICKDECASLFLPSWLAALY